MTRQESGVIAVCISTYGSTLFADFLVEPPEQVINLRACSPVSSLTFSQHDGAEGWATNRDLSDFFSGPAELCSSHNWFILRRGGGEPRQFTS